MSDATAADLESSFRSQPNDVRRMNSLERDQLIVSFVRVNGICLTRSHYGDQVWHLIGGTTNQAESHKTINFSGVPVDFQACCKQLMYRYIRRGRDLGVVPSAATIFSKFTHVVRFFNYLESLRIDDLSKVTPMVCANYVGACRDQRQVRKKNAPPLSPGTLEGFFSAVELVHELSQFSTTPMLDHPWPDNSARNLAGLRNRDHRSKTPLMPDEIFARLFEAAWATVQAGEELLNIRDELQKREQATTMSAPHHVKSFRLHHIKLLGWKGSYRELTEALTEIRTACYIVVASLSGCRNHELAYVKKGAFYRTEDDSGETYWWMRSRSDKTYAGDTEWMIPEAAVTALSLMERWAEPYQIRLHSEIVRRQGVNPRDAEIAEAMRHVGALFVGDTNTPARLVRTLKSGAWRVNLKSFAKKHGIEWDISPHQFRRKFANYAARSKFGDLRYLRQHFTHWSQDMTNDGYALNESQEMELYAEIQDEMDATLLGLVDGWLTADTPLAGGYGKNLVEWRSKPEVIAMFKDRESMVRAIADSHAIRSNGHAWCTADDNKCIGNTFEKTRCSSCDNAVVGVFHARLYQRLYRDLKELSVLDDIGPGGQARVQRDLERCRDVLLSLGFDPEASP